MPRKLGHITKIKIEKPPIPELDTKVGKYYLAKKSGKSKKEAQIVAGYSTPTHATSIEKSDTYQAIERYFKSELLSQITMSEIAEALVDNIKQTGEEKIDRGARNKAIEIALEKIEGDGQASESEDIIVVLKPAKERVIQETLPPTLPPS